MGLRLEIYRGFSRLFWNIRQFWGEGFSDGFQDHSINTELWHNLLLKTEVLTLKVTLKAEGRPIPFIRSFGSDNEWAWNSARGSRIETTFKMDYMLDFLKIIYYILKLINTCWYDSALPVSKLKWWPRALTSSIKIKLFSSLSSWQHSAAKTFGRSLPKLRPSKCLDILV